jgi:glutamyl-tRNA synthetase
VKKAAAYFDQRKLDWLNGQYIKHTPVPTLAGLLAERLIARGWLRADYDRPWLERIAALVRDRLMVLEDIEEQHGFFFIDQLEYQQDAVAKFLRQDGVGRRLLELKDRLQRLASFKTSDVEQAVRGMIAEQGLQSKELIHPTRVAVTGRSVSPPLFESMSIIGKSKVLSRLGQAAKLARE